MHAITLGQTLSVTDLAHITLNDVRYNPNSHFKRHAHTDTYMCFVLRGAFDECVGQTVEHVTSAALVIMPAGVDHSERFGSLDGRSLVIGLRSSFLELMKPIPRCLQRWAIVRSTAIARAALHLYREYSVFSGIVDVAAEERILNILGILSDTADSDSSSAPKLATKTAEILVAHSRESLRLGNIARMMGVDPGYLARVFRRHYRTTMGAFLRSVRARAAADLLASTDLPAAQVALTSGFADQSHLGRVFRTELGITPLAYRRFAMRPH